MNIRGDPSGRHSAYPLQCVGSPNKRRDPTHSRTKQDCGGTHDEWRQKYQGSGTNKDLPLLLKVYRSPYTSSRQSPKVNLTKKGRRNLPPARKTGGGPTTGNHQGRRRNPNCRPVGRQTAPPLHKTQRTCRQDQNPLPQGRKSRRELQTRDRGFDITLVTPFVTPAGSEGVWKPQRELRKAPPAETSIGVAHGPNNKWLKAS